LGITGWVRNRKGAGHVEVIAQGSRENLEKFLLLIRRGPQFAKVRKVQVEWRQGVEEFKHFRIIKD
jgi:acylphosphatase